MTARACDCLRPTVHALKLITKCFGREGDSPLLVLRPQRRLEGPGAALAEVGPVGGVADPREGRVAVVLVAVVTQSAEKERKGSVTTKEYTG